MNWKEIVKKESPKAWRKLVQFVYGEDTKRDGVAWGTDFTERDLFDFFDKQGILICIEFNIDLQLLECWIVTKHEDGKWSGGMIGAWKPSERTKAEEAGWNKAFEMLEE